MIAQLDGLAVHYRDEGDPSGHPLVFANSLGTDLRLWDAVMPLLPKSLRLIRYDKRGHGLTQATPAPYAMGQLIRDAELLLDHLGIRKCTFVGLSIGGLIAQGLAVKRLDQIAAMVLANTAAKIGTPQSWAERAAAVEAGGIAALSDAVMERWFSRPFRAAPEMLAWKHMLERQPVQGYTGCCAAIAGTDFLTTTSGLRLPTLAIAGSEDGATPPDLVRETADLIPGSQFRIIRGAGHLPCVETPEAFARLLTDFVQGNGHA